MADGDNNGREAVLREVIRSQLAVIRLGIDMRRKQRLYFRATPGTKEKSALLEQSMVAERTFDAAAAQAEVPSFPFGGGHAEKS
jgi:hypothetical protein